MEEYRINTLKQYIDDSELRIINKKFKVRLSRELSKKYDDGMYNKAISKLVNYINEIESLNIKYPSNANPIFYLYLVPDENFVELLDYPYKEKRGGGKPVPAYDLDSFNSAYGESQNLANNIDEPSISKIVNTIHELAHLVHSQFFSKNCFICEGFAEALTLYTMNYESLFDEHREALKTMKKSQILSVKELLTMEKTKRFYGGDALLENKSCSFDLTYISSYLFVRGYMEQIRKKFECNEAEATQKFLELVKNSKYTSEWLVFDLASALNISKEELLCGKEMQFNILSEL